MRRFDLGSHSKVVSTTSAEAQRWFDQGLNWCFGFNRTEALRCFQKALEVDAECVMAHWGVAYAAGPFYNLTWREHGEQEATDSIELACRHISAARSLASRATALENRLVEAMACRFQAPRVARAEEFDRWDDDYAAEMRRVYHAFPYDADVASLFVEALLMRTPRRLWDVKTGAPAIGSDVLEALQVCESSIAQLNDRGMRPHPALLHFHIHALEMSNHPQRAMASADVLAQLCPDAGHLNHMPGHIYVLCGDYERAWRASKYAVRANDTYIAYAGPFTFYTVACCHDLHLMMHACMLLGRYKDAIEAACKTCHLLTKEVLSVKGHPKFTMSLEGYYSTKMHVLVRFGRWWDIVNEPLPDDPQRYLISTAMTHYAKGIAQASLKNLGEAERERKCFHKSLECIPSGHRFFNNSAHDILAVGGKMLDGEVEYHKGNYCAAYAHLRDSVWLDDNLNYIEPWAWMHPPRHALAALLAEQGHHEEAEGVYRGDLGLSDEIQRCAQHPNNVWALHGLVECLERRGDTSELPGVRRKLTDALAIADIPITSSCMCRTSVYKQESCCSPRS